MRWHTRRNQISVFRRNGRVHLNRRGTSVQSTTGSRGVRISGSNVGYTMFRGSVKGTGYPIHSLVSPSLPHPCGIVCHHISTGLYHITLFIYSSQVFLIVMRMHPVFYISRKSPQWAMASSLSRFLDHTQRRTTVGRTPLDE